jgi:hypothetical protein
MSLNAGIDWKLMMDGIQMLLLLVVLALVLWNRVLTRRLPVGSRPKDLPLSFGGEMNRQAIRQQMLAALDQVIRTAVAERSNVQRMFEDSDETQWSEDLPFQDSADTAPVEASSGLKNPRQASGDPSPGEELDEINLKYADIRKMAAEGHDAKRISETLDLPVGEVGLLLKLRRTVPGSRAVCH